MVVTVGSPFATLALHPVSLAPGWGVSTIAWHQGVPLPPSAEFGAHVISPIAGASVLPTPPTGLLVRGRGVGLRPQSDPSRVQQLTPGSMLSSSGLRLFGSSVC